MARPLKSTERYTKRLSIRLTQADYDRYIEILENAKDGNKKYTASDFIRDAIYSRQPPAVITKKVSTGVSECDRDRVRMLANTTNNINQLAKAANIALRSDPDQLIVVMQSLEDLVVYIKGELC